MAVHTLGQLKTRVRQKAQLEDDSNEGITSISDSELTTYINTGIEHLVDLVEGADSDFYLRRFEFTLAADQDAYQIPPSVVASLRGVDYVESATRAYAIQPYVFAERNQIDETGYYDEPPYRYHWTGDDLNIIPTPSTSATFRVHFVPVQEPLENDSDSFNFYNGWDQFVVLDAAIQCGDKLEDDMVQRLVGERTRIEDRVLKAAQRRDVGSPEYVVDVYAMNGRRRW